MVVRKHVRTAAEAEEHMAQPAPRQARRVAVMGLDLHAAARRKLEQAEAARAELSPNASPIAREQADAAVARAQSTLEWLHAHERRDA